MIHLVWFANSCSPSIHHLSLMFEVVSTLLQEVVTPTIHCQHEYPSHWNCIGTDIEGFSQPSDIPVSSGVIDLNVFEPYLFYFYVWLACQSITFYVYLCLCAIWIF